MRTGPGTGYPKILTVPRGTSPQYNCWTQGDRVGGVDVWFNVTYGGQTGFITSKYDDSHYAKDSDITGKYGIPHCGDPTPTPTPQPGDAKASQAISYASARVGSTAYNGACLRFVREAWASAGVDLRSQVTVAWGSNTYPQDIWGHFRSGTTGTGNPPPGALAFYLAKSGRSKTYSHITIATDRGGNTISTNDTVDRNKVHAESISQHSSSGAYNYYVGWWMPAH